MTVDVHYRTDGTEAAEPVVLSGSLGSDLGMWEPQVAPLVRAGHRVVRYDHRGLVLDHLAGTAHRTEDG